MKKTTYINKTEHKEKTTTVIENMYGMLMSYVNVYSSVKEHIRPAIMFQILFCTLTLIFSLFYDGFRDTEYGCYLLDRDH